MSSLINISDAILDNNDNKFTSMDTIKQENDNSSPDEGTCSDMVINTSQTMIIDERGDEYDNTVTKDIHKNDDDQNTVDMDDDSGWNTGVVKDEIGAKTLALSPSRDDDHPLIYHLKWVNWKGNKIPIVTQNENGPCPLLAIINVLILKGRIQLPSMMEIITANQLMEYLGDCIISNVPKNIPEGAQLNYEQNFQDAMSILPKLPKGLDVNVRFSGISDFEYTPECIVFDLLHIPLYHGWLIDPEDIEVLSSVGNCSYNQLVDKIINNKTSLQPELVTEALIAEQFLEKSASQLTYHGLLQLINNLKDDEMSVLFRNNHFITLHKHKNQLYQLVTDQGFLTETTVVWETLNNIEGDGEFVDGDFVIVPPKAALPPNVASQQQIDQDYLVALSLHEEQKKHAESTKEWEQFKHESGMEGLTDEELARRLQQEEDTRTSQRQQQQPDDQSLNHPQQPNQCPQNQQQSNRSQSQSNPSQNANSPSTRRNGGGNSSNSNGESSNKSKSKNVSA